MNVRPKFQKHVNFVLIVMHLKLNLYLISSHFYFRIIITGPSQCGKTSFILQCLKYQDKVFSTKFESITYFLPAETSYAKEPFVRMLETKYSNVRVHFGLPEYSHIFGSNLPKMFIIDDQMTETASSSIMEKIFTRDSHHQNITVLFVAQNYFKNNQNIIRNCTYRVVFR